jgi:lipopolysaccharide export system protein LptA
MRRVALRRYLSRCVAIMVATLLVLASQGLAQTDRKGPGLFKGSPQQRNEPIRITSATLEVRDKSKMATFQGDVHVIQGDTDVRCQELVVFYDDDSKGKDKVATAAKKAPAPAADSSRGSQQIRRMEARGSVVVTQKDQRAVGDRAEFDIRTNTVTLTGNVVVTNPDNVVRGHRMVVDLTTGVARMGEPGSSGRVEGVFNSKQPPRPGKQN